MSLAEELAQLASLHKDGLLSAEQFEAAKAQLLGLPAPTSAATNTTTTSTSSSTPTPTPTSLPQPAPVNLQVGLTALADSVSETEALEAAVAVLTTVLNNISNNPNDAKYRTLKKANKRMAAQLFPVDGVSTFLLNSGFVETEAEFVYNGEGLSNDVVFQLSKVILAREHRERAVQRREVKYEIRAEQRKKHLTDGSIISYCRDELLCNGDLPHLIASLRSVLQHVIENPGEARYRKVNVTEKFEEECLCRFGSQEFLLDVAGWALEIGEKTSPTVFPKMTLMLAEEKVPIQAEAASFLDTVLESYTAAHQREEEEKRAAARQQVKMIMQAHRGGGKKEAKETHVDTQVSANAGKKVCDGFLIFCHIQKRKVKCICSKDVESLLGFHFHALKVNYFPRDFPRNTYITHHTNPISC